MHFQAERGGVLWYQSPATVWANGVFKSSLKDEHTMQIGF